jgi:hypothetical protein
MTSEIDMIRSWLGNRFGKLLSVQYTVPLADYGQSSSFFFVFSAYSRPFVWLGVPLIGPQPG